MTGPLPARRGPSCGTVLDGGPVVFWCAGCRRGVQAAHQNTTGPPSSAVPQDGHRRVGKGPVIGCSSRRENRSVGRAATAI